MIHGFGLLPWQSAEWLGIIVLDTKFRLTDILFDRANHINPSTMMADEVFTTMSKDECTEIALRCSTKAPDSRTHLLSKENAETTFYASNYSTDAWNATRRSLRSRAASPRPRPSTNDPHAKFRKEVVCVKKLVSFPRIQNSPFFVHSVGLSSHSSHAQGGSTGIRLWAHGTSN
jgi:hypothetical protein